MEGNQVNVSDTIYDIPIVGNNDKGSDNEADYFADDWSPDCPSEKKPVMNQWFKDIDSGFSFYKEYGRSCGFDVRRSSEKHDKFGKTIRKYFICSRAGNNEKSKSDAIVKRKRRTVSGMCDCPAQLVLKPSKDDGYYVSKFVENHNHNFAGKGSMQFLRCSRTLTDFHKRFVADAAKLNIGATRAHAILKSMIGTYENVGATVVDFKNFARDIKNYIGKHDADMIVQKFKDLQANSDCEFRFEYKTDSANHLTQLFWADGISRRNFEVFGDVLSFDATYRTNKYGMVFIPLIGIDNHWKSVTFGAILLEKEDSDNYIWACEAVKKVLGSNLKCIITDQDPAMKIAIEISFPRVKHRLCMWHIMKKFPAKLGTLFCAESDFMEKLSNFVWSDHISPEEFEAGWKDVISEFDQNENPWLKEIYDLREYWVPAYFNDEQMAGLLRTTSRSESSNFYFNHFVQRGDTLSEFYLCFTSALEKQRNINSQLNRADELMPNTITKKRIEKDAADLYTRNMFYRIQEEIVAATGEMMVEAMFEVDNKKRIKVKDPFNKDRIFEVSLDLETNAMDCSCKLYNRVGYLCSHSFLLLGMSGIPSIPRQHVNNRWLKKAEQRFTTLELGVRTNSNSIEEEKRTLNRECWFEFQGCISDASADIDYIRYVKQGLNLMRNHIKESKKNGTEILNANIIEDHVGSGVVEEITIQVPNQSNNKGSKKRIIGAVEKSLGGKKRYKRKCANCHQLAFHDSRNCPAKV